MADIENRYLLLTSGNVDDKPVTAKHWSNSSIALIGGSCLMLLSFAALSVSSSTLQSTSAAESTNLIGLSPFLRSNTLGRKAQQTMPQTGAACPAMVPISGNSRDLSALAKYAANQIVAQRRDISMKAEGNEFADIAAERLLAEQMKETAAKEPQLNATDMAGISGPMGFLDPFGFTTDCTTGRLLFYREVELKHGRVAMLAALGILVGENFHPLFGGDIDVPAYVAFQQTPLQKFWPSVVAAIAIPEFVSISHFESPFGMNIVDQVWKIKKDHQPGDFGFDPLGLKPTDPAEFKEMQTKELNNGRLAMIAAAGMIAQELATGEKIFGR